MVSKNPLQNQPSSLERVVFSWDVNEFEALLASCEYDEAVQLSLKYMHNKLTPILEAGSGLGRVVKYFNDLGYKDVHGIELNKEAVEWFQHQFPTSKMIAGDILNMPYEDEKFDIIVSYGVIEHFKDTGLVVPLQALFRVLKPGGIAIVTVPSMNILRQLRHYSSLFVGFLHPRYNPFIRRFFGKVPRNSRRNGYLYCVKPQYGRFFEYRLTPKEFEAVCKQAGFRIIESVPVAHIDGIYKIFGSRLTRFANWRFYPTRVALYIDKIFRCIPFFHNHMHACVLIKEVSSGE